MAAPHRRALIGLVLAAALWGVSFPLTKSLMLEHGKLWPGGSTWFFSAWMIAARFAIGGIVLAPWMIRVRCTPAEIRQGLVLAGWGGFGIWFQCDALGHTAASTSAFLTQGYCVFLPLWFALRHRRRPSARVVGATLLVVAGVAWISGVSPSDLRLGRGETETLIAAFLFTFQILALEDPRFAGNRSLPVTFVMFAAIGLLFSVVTLVAAPSPAACLAIGMSLPSAVLAVVLALLSTVLPYALMNHFQRGVPATQAGMLYCSEPVFTAVYVLFLPAWLGAWTGNPYPNEVWALSLAGGGLLITGANLLLHAPICRRTPGGA